MSKYLLRAVKQVFVLQLTGEERVVDCETEQQLHLEGVKFLSEVFPGQIDVELEIKKFGADGSVQAAQDSGPKPGTKDTTYGSPF